MSLLPLLLLAPIGFAGSFIYGLTGFGSGLVAVPLASLMFDLPFALAVFALIDTINAFRVWASHPKAVSWPDAGRLMPACVVGVATGAMLVLWLPTRQLMLSFGVFVLAYALYGLLAPGRLPVIGLRWAWLAGLAGGLTSSMFGAGGPPFVIYLSMRPLPKEQMRATQALTSVVSIVSRVTAFALGGLLSSSAVWTAAALVAPASLLALWWSNRIHTRWSRETMIRAIQVMLCVAGVSMMYRGMTAG